MNSQLFKSDFIQKGNIFFIFNFETDNYIVWEFLFLISYGQILNTCLLMLINSFIISAELWIFMIKTHTDSWLINWSLKKIIEHLLQTVCTVGPKSMSSQDTLCYVRSVHQSNVRMTLYNSLLNPEHHQEHD